jgi:hypothetical protein
MAPRKRGRTTSYVGTVYRDRDERREEKLPGAVRDWQVECVCGGNHKTCNNGWMRRLENAAKPIMTPLIQGKSVGLSAEDQKLIATWAVLKSIVSEYHVYSHPSTHWKQRQTLRLRLHPPKKHWAVWIGHYERKNWKPEWLSSPFFLPSKAIQARRGIREPTYYNGSTTTQVIGKLFIQVMHIPAEFFTEPKVLRNILPPTNGAVFRVWPDQESAISWPRRALTDRDADNVAGALQNMLREIAH